MSSGPCGGMVDALALGASVLRVVGVRVSPGAQLKLTIMKKVKCPKCESDVPLDISKAVDVDGEVFRCKNCNYLFRYVEH